MQKNPELTGLGFHFAFLILHLFHPRRRISASSVTNRCFMAQHIRRAVIVCVLVASMVALNGCWVFSIYPLASSDDELVFDKFLAGNWWNQQNRCSVSFSRFPDERAYRVVYITGKDASESCWLDKGSSASFHGTVLELGGGGFLGVPPARLP